MSDRNEFIRELSAELKRLEKAGVTATEDHLRDFMAERYPEVYDAFNELVRVIGPQIRQEVERAFREEWWKQ